MKIPMLKGWNFSEREIQKAKKNNLMLMLDTETSNLCNLNCPYCYRDEYSKKHIVLDNELTIEQRKKLIDEAKQLGCKTIKIVGAGEPLIDLLFWEQLEYISQLGLIAVVFTNGIALTKEKSQKLLALNCSIMLKFNSFKNSIQDELVGRERYTKLRNKSLKILLDTGFNKTKLTRLGFDSVITKQNKKEILDIFRFCRKNNIFPMIKTFIPTGGALKYKDWEISKEDFIELLDRAQEIDEKEFGIKYKASLPYIGGFPCTQWHYALFVDILGNVYVCPGSRILLGNIKEDSLIDIWNSPKARKFRVNEYSSCPPRENYWGREHGKIVKEHFEIKYYDYDKLIRKLIPKYKEMHNLVVKLVNFPLNKPLRILDLGIGTGQTALYLLKKFPNAVLDGVDISPKMIQQAKIRLKDYSERVSFSEIDLKDLKIKNKYDACIAVLSIHHLNKEQKPLLFKKVFNGLKDYGIFIMGDIIKFDSEKETKEKEEEWRNFLIRNLGEKEGQYWFKNYQEEDLPSSVSNQLKWLRQVGFKKVKCIWEYMNYVVLYGEK